MSVVSKNPFDLLGDDGDESPAPKVAPKAAAPAAEAKPKRDVPGAKTPAGAASGAGAQRGGRYPNRGGPRNVYKGDRTPPAADSVPEGTETGVFDGERAPPSRKSNHTRDAHTKGPRGSRPAKSYTSGGHTSSRSNIGGAKTPAQGGERRQFERRSGTIADSQKKVDQGWGANEGSAELTAEVEGQTDAITEEKAEAAGPDAVEADAAPVEEEPEEVQRSLDDYLAERASAALGILGKKEGRTVTADTLEGSKFAREGIAEFFSGKEKTAAAKSKAPKKEKVFIEFDGQFARPAGEREQRGERRGGDRDGSAPRGGARGGRGQGPRGGARGGAGAARGGQTGGAQRGPRSQAIDANDTSAFPALGA